MNANQDLYRSIVEQLDHGESVETAYGSTKVSLSPDLQPTPFDTYRLDAANSVIYLREIYGDQRIAEALKLAILKRPFRIHRK